MSEEVNDYDVQAVTQSFSPDVLRRLTHLLHEHEMLNQLLHDRRMQRPRSGTEPAPARMR
jgi:glycine cleavage system regulatory protein